MQKNLFIKLPLIITGFLLLTASLVSAQTQSQVILTWHANNFYPSDFEGKPDVTRNTVIELSAETLKNNVFIDTSKATFYWYVDEKLINKGVGLKEILYTGNKVNGDNYFVHVVIKNGSETYESAERIPVKNYELVLDVPFPNNILPSATQTTIRVTPYFFTIASLNELNFSWKINNAPQPDATGNELTLNIGSPSGESESLRIEARAYNQTNPLEFAITYGELFIMR